MSLPQGRKQSLMAQINGQATQTESLLTPTESSTTYRWLLLGVVKLFHGVLPSKKDLRKESALIPRQRNSSRETVYAKYGWFLMNNSIEFSLREKKLRFASEYNRFLPTGKSEIFFRKQRTQWNYSTATTRIRINGFSQRISLSWD